MEAKHIKTENTPNGEASLFKLEPAHEGHQFVKVSAARVFMPLGSNEVESFIFASDEQGEIKDWTELPGSAKGVFSTSSPLRSLGYKIT